MQNQVLTVKDCPHCGHPIKISSSWNCPDDHGQQRDYVTTFTCNTCACITTYKEDESAATAKWNHRV